MRRKVIISLILATILTIMAAAAYKNLASSQTCRMTIVVMDEGGRAVKGAIVTVWAWHPGEESEIVAMGETDERGVIEGEVDWRGLMRGWLERAGRGIRERVGLIISVYHPTLGIVATETMLISVGEKNPGVIGKIITIRTNMTGIGSKKVSEPTRGLGTTAIRHEEEIGPKRLSPVIEEWEEYRGRTNLVYVKTDQNTKADMGYGLLAGEETAVRLVIGYDFSDYTTVGGVIYSITHSSSASVHPSIGYSSEVWVSMILTTRFEVVAYYWQDEDGNLVLMYREFRLWAYDLDINSLKGVKGEEPAWGSFSERTLKDGTGKGFYPTERALVVDRLDFYISNVELIEIPISAVFYAMIGDVLDALGFPASLLPTMKIVIDQSKWAASYFVCSIWGPNGYAVVAYGYYVSVHGLCFMALRIYAYPPSPPGGGQNIPT